MMGQATIATSTLAGVEAVPVEVQADVSPGLPVFGIVGLADVAVQEARDRVRAALRTAGYDFPNARVIVNLAPAPLRKHGTGFDLPIALAILSATGQIPSRPFTQTTAVGELGLDGSVRPVPGMLAHAIAASRDGLDLLGPHTTALTAGVVPGLRFRAIESIASVRSGLPAECARECTSTTIQPDSRPEVDLTDIAGHESAKRALEIAAAGAHNILLVGPPGTGKTLLARALAGLLPPLHDRERLETALVHSVAGLDPVRPLAGARPFRAPHHSCTIAGLVGGGSPPRPGELSLAHNGVLFLDEFPEFGPAALQALRQPLESGVVTLVRAGGIVRYPALVTLAAAMNPCPCGYSGDPQRECTCSTAMLARYSSRIGGPLFDRIDLTITVDRIDPTLIIDHQARGDTSAAVGARVLRAREFAASRPQVPVRSALAPAARALLQGAARTMQLSGRAVTRVLRVARTIADLDFVPVVSEAHIAEALGFRRWEPS